MSPQACPSSSLLQTQRPRQWGHRQILWISGMRPYPRQYYRCAEYILGEITEGPGKNIQIPGLPRAVVLLAPVKFWYNAGHGKRRPFGTICRNAFIRTTNFKVPTQMMLLGAALDIQSPARGTTPSASPYVQLLRVPSLDMVFILRHCGITRAHFQRTTCGASMGGGNGVQRKGIFLRMEL